MQMRPSSRSQNFTVEQGRSDEYGRAKRILSVGKHPTFIGRQTYAINARNGGVTFFVVDGEDIAVSIANPRTNCLLVLCVLPVHRSRGVGTGILQYLQLNFARVIESAVPFFESNGFISIGLPKQGKRFKTQIMVAKGLRELAGRLRSLRYPAK